MTTLRQALDAIKENLGLVLIEGNRLRFDHIVNHEIFKHTSSRGISIALEEMVFENIIQCDKDGYYFIITD